MDHASDKPHVSLRVILIAFGELRFFAATDNHGLTPGKQPIDALPENNHIFVVLEGVSISNKFAHYMIL